MITPAQAMQHATVTAAYFLELKEQGIETAEAVQMAQYYASSLVFGKAFEDPDAHAPWKS